MTLNELVKEAYENATFNGYNLELMTDQEVAIDMAQYDADLESYALDEILRAVQQYRKESK